MKGFFFKSVIFCVCCIAKILVLRQHIDGHPKYVKYDREKKERVKDRKSESERKEEREKEIEEKKE